MHRTSGIVFLAAAGLFALVMLLWPVRAYGVKCGSAAAVLSGSLDATPMAPSDREECTSYARGRVATTVTLGLPLVIAGILFYLRGPYPDNPLRWPTDK